MQKPASSSVKPTAMLAWLIFFLVIVSLVLMFQGMLAPFIIGFIVAYALNPVVVKLTTWRLPRAFASLGVVGLFVFGIVLAVMALAPLIQVELAALLRSIPEYISRLATLTKPFLDKLSEHLSSEEIKRISDGMNEYVGDALRWLARIAGDLIGSSVALANILTLTVITPVISFYMLKDWEKILSKIQNLIPRSILDSVMQVSHDVDNTLAGFARGQALVCLIMAAFYSIGLSLTGLNYSLLLGIATGLLTCVPYVGVMLGTLTGLAVAFFQFGDWVMLVKPLIVFGAGIAFEGYILTPKLVGDRIGLHPVWIIFAVLAGGHLKGLVGILIALPTASILNVIIRYGIERYKTSSFYRKKTSL